MRRSTSYCREHSAQSLSGAKSSNDLRRPAQESPRNADLRWMSISRTLPSAVQPVGQKLIETWPAIAQQTAQIGEDVSRRAADDLRLRLTEALRQKGDNP